MSHRDTSCMRLIACLLLFASARLPSAEVVVDLEGKRLLTVGPLPEGASVRYADGALLLEGTLPDEGSGEGLALRLTHAVDAALQVWVPHLAPEEGFVMGDHCFRSPAVIVANDQVSLALIPDLLDVAAGYQAGWRTWMDYDHPERAVTLAAGNYEVAGGHVLYQKRPLDYHGQQVRLRLHVVASSRSGDLRNPYGLAARWIWERWGRPAHERGGSQRAPLSKYCEYVTRWAFSPEGWGETVWQSFEIDGRKCGAPAFIVDVAQHPSVPLDKRRWREQRSIWNQAWFSTQRCTNGLLRYARRTGSKTLEEKARLSTELALAAPQSDGLFPAVYTTAPPDGAKWYQLYEDTPGWDQGRWSNSDRRPPGVSEHACHILDAAFTARLLLEWQELTGDPRVEEYVGAFADRLVRLQRPGGAFPGWVEPDGTVPPTLAEGPESAMGATLLFELASRAPGRNDWKKAAFRAVQYLEDGPIAEGRWEDFETYFSCCRWGGNRIGERIERNGVFKQNTFSPFWCAEALLAAYRSSGRNHYLEVGRRCLDELSLFQQVWDPPFIPAPCHGGFGVMNSDGEWNDARQSLFAPLYLEYYRETGFPDYFERGVAALRASFAMMYCPENEQVKRQYELKHPFFGPESHGFMMENIAHGGPAPADGSAIGPFTIYTWGNGAAMASAARIHDLFGDLYVDVERGRAFGVDGCSADIESGRLRVHDRYGRKALVAKLSTGAREEIPLEDGRGERTLGLPAEPDLWRLAKDRIDVHRFATLFTAQNVRDLLSSDEGLDGAIEWCRRTAITHVFLETFRNRFRAEREALVRARDRFREAGIDVSGCVTTTEVGKKSTGWKIIACYTDSETQKTLKSIFEYTASIFDEIMIDDFWFTDCACTDCDRARSSRKVRIGERSFPVEDDTWAAYRCELLVRLSQSHVLEAAKRVNPRARLIIKYPQWYDRFHERGYDVIRESRDFDRIWVGTETRDYDDERWGGTVQYEAYFIMRWLGGIGGEKCGGGWFDPYGTTEDTYVEQARQTVLGGARESLLFCYGSLLQDTGPANVQALRKEIPELLDVASRVSRRRPVGVAAYKPPSSAPGDEARIFDFVGMMGIPLVPCHELPEPSAEGHLPPGTKAAFFSVHAMSDPDFLEKLEALLADDAPVLLTDGLASLLEGKLDLERGAVRILEVHGDPKSLLGLAEEELTAIRAHVLRDVSFRAPNRVALYLFDDGSRVVENFNDKAVTVDLDGARYRIAARDWLLQWKGKR